MMVLILVKLFEIRKVYYPVIILCYGLIVWFIGYIFDKSKMQFYFDQAYFDRGKIRKKLEEMR